MEIIVVLGIVLAILGGIFWMGIISKRRGQTYERERAYRKMLDDMDEANRIARDVERRGAAERLRDGYTRD